MALNEKALQHLARLGYVKDSQLKFWRHLWQSEGESFFWGFLRKEEEAAGEYRRWFSQLYEASLTEKLYHFLCGTR